MKSAAPLSDLAISLYLPDETPATTNDLLALQKSYVSPDNADSTALAKFVVAKTISSWPFLTGVEVGARAGGAAIVNAKAGPGYCTPENESVRQEVNAWLRDSREFDGLIDLDGLLRDPDHATRLLPAYDSGDHLHPNDAGYAAAADAIPLSVLGIR
jgi:lysophospholipase L1-like esterase